MDFFSSVFTSRLSFAFPKPCYYTPGNADLQFQECKFRKKSIVTLDSEEKRQYVPLDEYRMHRRSKTTSQRKGFLVKKFLLALLIAVLAFLAYLYLFTNPENPDGLRQKIFAPLGLATAPEENVEGPKTVKKTDTGEKEQPQPSPGKKTPEGKKQIRAAYRFSLEALDFLKKRSKNKGSDDIEKYEKALLDPPGNNPEIRTHAPLFIDAARFLARPAETAQQEPDRIQRLMAAAGRKECNSCRNSILIPCKRCRGTGKITVIALVSSLIFKKTPDENLSEKPKEKVCPVCNGTGKTLCKKCISRIRFLLLDEENTIRKEIKKALKNLQRPEVERNALNNNPDQHKHPDAKRK